MFAEERPSMLPVPIEPSRYYRFGKRAVHLDGCAEVEAAYYGVPPGWIGRRVSVQWDIRHVRLLNPRTGQLLREHLRQQIRQLRQDGEHVRLGEVIPILIPHDAILQYGTHCAITDHGIHADVRCAGHALHRRAFDAGEYGVYSAHFVSRARRWIVNVFREALADAERWNPASLRGE